MWLLCTFKETSVIYKINTLVANTPASTNLTFWEWVIYLYQFHSSTMPVHKWNLCGVVLTAVNCHMWWSFIFLSVSVCACVHAYFSFSRAVEVGVGMNAWVEMDLPPPHHHHHHPILTERWNKGKDSVLEYIYDHKEKERWFLLKAVKPFTLSFSSALDLGSNWHHSADCYC